MAVRSTLFAALLALVVPDRAASAVRIAVVPLSAPPELQFTGRSVAEVVAAEAAREPGYEVLGPEVVQEKLGPEAADALARCADSAPCLGERAAALGVDRVIAGWLQKTRDVYRIVMIHVDVKTGAKLGRLDREIPIASRRLRADIAAAAPELVRAMDESTGILKVVTDLPGADVTVDGQPAGQTPFAKKLKPGKHKVQVSRPGYQLQEAAWIEVTAAKEVTHKARLYPIPARVQPPGTTSTTVEVSR